MLWGDWSFLRCTIEWDLSDAHTHFIALADKSALTEASKQNTLWTQSQTFSTVSKVKTTTKERNYEQNNPTQLLNPKIYRIPTEQYLCT